jgi:hypothetical protein
VIESDLSANSRLRTIDLLAIVPLAGGARWGGLVIGVNSRESRTQELLTGKTLSVSSSGASCPAAPRLARPARSRLIRLRPFVWTSRTIGTFNSSSESGAQDRELGKRHDVPPATEAL